MRLVAAERSRRTLSRRGREREKDGGMRGLGREGANPSRRLKEAFVRTLTLSESVSSPGSSHKADVDCPGSAAAAAAVLSERVQRLLCMPVRDALPQISASSQMRDRCSRQPVDAERGLSLLITATWVMETSFFFFFFLQSRSNDEAGPRMPI